MILVFNSAAYLLILMLFVSRAYLALLSYLGSLQSVSSSRMLSEEGILASAFLRLSSPLVRRGGLANMLGRLENGSKGEII